MTKYSRFFLIAIASLVALLTGCSATAPSYQTSNANSMALAASPAKIDAGKVSLGPAGDKLNRLTIRGGSYKSPVQGSWAAYLEEAIKTELAASGRLDPNADIKVTGTLLENELDGSGSSIGTAHVKANFLVMRSTKAVFDKDLVVDKQWESSFIGGIAIPQAQQNYVATLSELLGKLFSDPDFIRATQ